MKLIKQVNAMAPIEEDAAGGAVGAGSIAMSATPLFSTLVQRSTAVAPKPKKPKKQKKKGIGLKEAFDAIGGDVGAGDAGGDQASNSAGARKAFDSAGVVSRLKGLEHKEKEDYRDTVTFGLEDEDGQLVRVVVKAEQAQQFEEALQAFLGAEEDDRPLEIGEILFKLKDQFDIVDVVWPDVQEDEEEDTSLSLGDEGDAEGGAPGDNAEGGLVGDDAEGGLDDLGGSPAADDSQASSLLTQVIDMMKADAEARKADAEARKAEAKTKEADAIVKQAVAKVKQEEQFLDMEAYNKAKKDEDREVKRLAQLAKWKHETSQEGGEESYDEPPMQQQAAPEEEERAFNRPSPVKKQQPRKGSTATRVRPQDVANYILNRVK